MSEPSLRNRLRRFGYGKHHGPMAKACAEASDEIGQLYAVIRALAPTGTPEAVTVRKMTTFELAEAIYGVADENTASD